MLLRSFMEREISYKDKKSPFGQISMYLGLLKEEFPGKDIAGVIVAGSIDPSLKKACSITDMVTLKVYRMSLELEDA